MGELVEKFVGAIKGGEWSEKRASRVEKHLRAIITDQDEVDPASIASGSINKSAPSAELKHPADYKLAFNFKNRPHDRFHIAYVPAARTLDITPGETGDRQLMNLAQHVDGKFSQAGRNKVQFNWTHGVAGTPGNTRQTLTPTWSNVGEKDIAKVHTVRPKR